MQTAKKPDNDNRPFLADRAPYRANLLALHTVLEKAVAEIGDVRLETMRQSAKLGAAGLDPVDVIRELKKSEAALATAFCSVSDALTREVVS